MFIELILKNWKLIVAIGLVAVMAGLGVYIRILHGDISTLEEKAKTAQAELEVSQASVKSLQIAINDQNTAIDKLKTDTDAREKAHAVEIAVAKTTANTAKKRAADLMASMAPQNISKCDAANQLINSEIQRAK
jgi:predicted  nucleic acid-binding Zn-ribbon protein